MLLALFTAVYSQLDERDKFHFLAVTRKFPQFFREEYPTIVTFVEDYFSYIDTTHIGRLDSIKDIDEAQPFLLDSFKKQFTPDIPEFRNFQLRNFIKYAKEFYTTKGTEDSIKFLFRVMFGEEVLIDYPGRNVLKASDGRWKQPYFIQVNTQYNAGLTVPFTLEFSNSRGSFEIDVTEVVDIGNNQLRFVFEKKSQTFLDDGQMFRVFDSSRTPIFVGNCVKSLAKIEVSSGGTSWQVGQVLTLPGGTKNTLARVTRVNSSGGIANAEVLDFGIGHTENAIDLISPYPYRPSSSGVTISKTLTSTGPNVFRIDLGITDYLDGYSESVSGFSPDNTLYFAETDYTSSSYVGTKVIQQIATNPVLPLNPYSEITTQQWLDSRATLILRFGNEVKMRGLYETEDGMLSNSSIFLEDNFFFQNFSYVIETTKDERDYANTLNLTHPAGMMRFSNMRKEFDADSSQISVSRSISSDTLYLTDSYSISESLSKIDSKKFADSITLSDSTSKIDNKYLSDSVTISDSGAPITNTVSYATSGYFADVYANTEYDIFA